MQHALLILATLVVYASLAGAVHTENSLPEDSCLGAQIHALGQVAAATTLDDQNLAMGRAQAYRALADLGQTC